MKNITAKFEISKTACLVFPIDRESEKQLEEFVKSLDHFPANLKHLLVLTIQNPLLESRVAILEQEQAALKILKDKPQEKPPVKQEKEVETVKTPLQSSRLSWIQFVVLLLLLIPIAAVQLNSFINKPKSKETIDKISKTVEGLKTTAEDVSKKIDTLLAKQNEKQDGKKIEPSQTITENVAQTPVPNELETVV